MFLQGSRLGRSPDTNRVSATRKLQAVIEWHVLRCTVPPTLEVRSSNHKDKYWCLRRHGDEQHNATVVAS